MSRRVRFLLVADSALLVLAYYLVFYLLAESGVPEAQRALFVSTLPLALPAGIAGLLLAGTYRETRGPVDVSVFTDIVRGSLYGAALFMAATVFLGAVDTYPLAAFVLYGAMVPFAAGLSRLAWRLVLSRSPAGGDGRRRRVLIVGAGREAEGLILEMRRDKKSGAVPVHAVADSEDLQGRNLHGVRVRGRVEDAATQARLNRADEIVIALPSADGMKMRRIAEKCLRAGLPCRTLPGSQDLVDGEGLLRRLRPLWLGDVVDRGMAPGSDDGVSSLLSGKKVLVTGAAGALGAEVCRQAARFGPASLALFDGDGERLAGLIGELGWRFPSLARRAVVGEVTNRCRVQEVMEEARPEVVIHAASQREVPLMQDNFREALLTNVIGTRTVVEAAASIQAGWCVHFSSGEALKPCNFTGLSFLLAEKVVLAMALMSEQTRFSSVRIGELLSEEAGVVALWNSQISAGGPVTVPHPEATRSFATAQHAVRLALRAAGTSVVGGELFVVDPGRRMKLLELARLAISIAGRKPEDEIEIGFVGERPGERLTEELPGTDDGMESTGVEGVWSLRRGTLDSELLSHVADMEELIKVCDGPREILMVAREMVPEYRPLGRKRV